MVVGEQADRGRPGGVLAVIVNLLLALLGAALVVAGVAFIYWPAALIVAGLGLLALGFFREVPDGDTGQ